MSIKQDSIIVNKQNPQWGSWKVKDSEVDGFFEIESERGTRMLDKSELHLWEEIVK